ncbi:hypothetical protein M422DRAFT_30070 [Sphaerobolus stellatus SS14]|uniref:Uncharacterized protein n=1 Tax=Sphaerobolus stellatus (strain SS14) TaxID=990650 RepID=A0A0C9VDT8_SPHS4|nr:hypothetical protein M422DRAFT_30070 [Sphaerobolus stellatus SS14]
MSRRPKASRVFLYCCLIVPVTFYAGFALRGRRISPSEDSDNRAPVAAVIANPEERIKWLRDEQKNLEAKRLDIGRKIADLQQRTTGKQ